MGDVEKAGRLDDDGGLGTGRSATDEPMFDLDVAMGSTEAGKVGDDGCVRDAGERLQPGEKLIVEALPHRRVLVAVMGQVQACGQEFVSVQEPVGGEGLQNLMDEDSGTGKQDQ